MLRVVQQVRETAPADAFAAECLPRIAPTRCFGLLVGVPQLAAACELVVTAPDVRHGALLALGIPAELDHARAVTREGIAHDGRNHKEPHRHDDHETHPE